MYAPLESSILLLKSMLRSFAGPTFGSNNPPYTRGTPIIGRAFFRNCSAEFDRNIATITLEWLKDGSSIVSSNSDGVLTLNISSVNVTDDGMYTCCYAVYRWTNLNCK